VQATDWHTLATICWHAAYPALTPSSLFYYRF
jgi:hypothetical protein